MRVWRQSLDKYKEESDKRVFSGVDLIKVKTKCLNDSWKLFVLRNDNGMEVHVLNVGAVITKVLVPDKNGKFENVVLGYKNYEDYEMDSNYLGAIIGRVSGRIKGAQFSLNGKLYELEMNDGLNHLHGGSYGFHQVMWQGVTFESNDGVGVTLSYLSCGGENGYPGNVKVDVTYTLTNDNELIMDYWAHTDETTPLTLTNHSYFNLTGNLRDTVHEHHVIINSSQFLELNESLIPTGKLINVENTPFDFRNGRKLSDGITSGDGQTKIAGGGFDHYFIYDHQSREKVLISEESSGRTLTIETNQPGMIMYTSNNLEEGWELAEGLSKKYMGVCFETQASPISLHAKGFPSVILREGDKYQKRTIFRFGVEK